MEKGSKVSAGNRRRVQVRKPRPGDFTEEKKQVFLDHLAGCCNVTRSAAAAGVSVETVNNHRRSDPAFQQQCDEALAIGYDTLHSAMLEEAAGGGHYRPGPGSEGAEAGAPDKELALHLLRLGRRPMGQRTGRAGYQPRRSTEKELNEAILAQLEVLARRLRSGKGPAAGSDPAA